MRAWKCRLKPGIVLTSTSKAPGNGTLVQRSLNQFSSSRSLRCTVYPWKIVGCCGRCCKPIRSGLGETMRGDLDINSDSSPWAQPLCCPLSFFIPAFSCSSVQIQTAGAALVTSNLLKSVIWFSQPFGCAWRGNHWLVWSRLCAGSLFPRFPGSFRYVWVCLKIGQKISKQYLLHRLSVLLEDKDCSLASAHVMRQFPWTPAGKSGQSVVELLPVSIALHRNKFRFAQSYSRGMARYGIVSMPQCHVYISYNYIYMYTYIIYIYIYIYNIYV